MKRLPTTLLLVLLASASRHVSAQEKPQFGPEAPAMPRDLEALRAEMKAQADANAQRFDAELARLKKELDAERAAREQERVEARAQAEATRKAVSESTVWHSGRF